jgi:hypothetical protein
MITNYKLHPISFFRCLSTIAQLLTLVLGIAVILFKISLLSCSVGVECRYDTDCLLDQLCVNSKCQSFHAKDGSQKRTCRYDTDCPDDALCIEGECRFAQNIFDASTEMPSLPDHNVPEPYLPDLSTPDLFVADTSTPEKPISPPDQEPPPPLGNPSSYHSFSSGGLMSSNSQHQHFAVVGQFTPLIPDSTVMRSPQYSLRMGIIAVTVW